jgi:pilus assembly protein CpaC
LVSALHPGTGTVRVKVAGKSETYAITVAALDPSVVSATKANDSVNSGERTAQAAPSTASALDPGAGPAKAAGTGTAAASTPANMNPMLPSQPASAEKYTKNPPASEAVDSLERESAVNGRHYLSPDAISMMTGTSRVYDFVAPLRRVSIADSKIADIQVINPHQLMLVGHNPGFTTLVVWDTQGHYQERQVRIEKEGHQQVVLNVIVAEIDRNKLEQQGIDYSIVFPKALVSFASLAGNVATPFNAQTSLNTTGPGGVSNGAIPPPGGNPFPLTLSTNITYALTAQNSNVWANSFFQFVEDHQLGRILAEPRLLANSGEEAKFLSGGEIPIVMATALSSSITFKQYGTSVEFLPTVVGRHDIELVVKPEVSSPDYSQGVSEYGFTIPAFVTRRAETAVRMKENQTLLIAGLIGDTVTSHINKVPYLGDIPWAGALFKNTYYEQDKTELVISVTPQIVQPIPVNGQVVLPTERPPMSPEDVRTKPLDVPDVTRERLQ